MFLKYGKSIRFVVQPYKIVSKHQEARNQLKTNANKHTRKIGVFREQTNERDHTTQ